MIIIYDLTFQQPTFTQLCNLLFGESVIIQTVFTFELLLIQQLINSAGDQRS